MSTQNVKAGAGAEGLRTTVGRRLARISGLFVQRRMEDRTDDLQPEADMSTLPRRRARRAAMRLTGPVTAGEPATGHPDVEERT